MNHEAARARCRLGSPFTGPAPRAGGSRQRARVDAQDKDGATALILALSTGTVREELVRGAGINDRTDDGRTAFDFAGHNRIMPQTAAYAQLRAAAQKAQEK